MGAGRVGLELQLSGFDPEAYQQRNAVERGINNHEQFRVATRYGSEYLLAATIDVASIRIQHRDSVP